MADTKDKRLEVRLTSKQLRTFKEAAEETGLSLSAWVVLRCMKAARKARKKRLESADCGDLAGEV